MPETLFHHKRQVIFVGSDVGGICFCKNIFQMLHKFILLFGLCLYRLTEKQ